MKIWVSLAAGGPETLVLKEVPIPPPRDGEILVRIQAVGVNFPDSLLIRDLYQIKPPRPLVPGSEFCGIVKDTGDGVTLFRPGDVVIGRCGWGAMAEYIALPQNRCVRIPNTLPRAEAAAFLFAYGTAYHALNDAARIQTGETLLVLGAAGGVGSAAIEIGRALGAQVLAGASTDAKLAYAMSRGASGGVVYESDLQPGDSQRNFAEKLKVIAPCGIDVVVDPVGGSYTEPALRSLARGGRHLVVGFTAGIPRVPLNLALLKSSHIIGVDWRTFVQEEPDANASNVEALLEMWHDHRIKPQVTESFPFSAAPQAIARLESRHAIGKIVVRMEEQL